MSPPPQQMRELQSRVRQRCLPSPQTLQRLGGKNKRKQKLRVRKRSLTLTNSNSQTLKKMLSPHRTEAGGAVFASDEPAVVCEPACFSSSDQEVSLSSSRVFGNIRLSYCLSCSSAPSDTHLRRRPDEPSIGQMLKVLCFAAPSANQAATLLPGFAPNGNGPVTFLKQPGSTSRIMFRTLS